MEQNDEQKALAIALRNSRFSQGVFAFDWNKFFKSGVDRQEGLPFHKTVSNAKAEMLLSLQAEIFQLYSTYANRILSRQALSLSKQRHVAQVNMVFEKTRDLDAVAQMMMKQTAGNEEKSKFFEVLRKQGPDKTAIMLSRPSRGVMKVTVLIPSYSVAPLDDKKYSLITGALVSSKSQFNPDELSSAAFVSHGGANNDGALLAMRPSHEFDPLLFLTSRRNYIYQQDDDLKRSGWTSVDLVKSRALSHFSWAAKDGVQYFSRSVLIGTKSGGKNKDGSPRVTRGNIIISWTDIFLMALRMSHDVAPNQTIALTYSQVSEFLNEIHEEIYGQEFVDVEDDMDEETPLSAI